MADASMIRFHLGDTAAQPTLILAVGERLNPLLAPHLASEFHVLQQVSSLDDLLGALRDDRPDTALVSRYLPGGDNLLSALPALRAAAPGCRLVLLLGDLDEDGRAIAEAAAAYPGCRTIAGQDLDVASIRSALAGEEAAEEGGALRLRREPVTSTAEAAHLVTTYAKVVAVVSGRGNVGKTTTVANLLAAARDGGAVGIDLDFGKPDLLLQFVPEDAQRGDLRELLNTLNIAPQKPGDPPPALDRRDLQILQSWVDKLPEVMPGVVVIPGPSRNIAAADVPRALVRELLHYAAQKSRLVIVDTAFEIADEAMLDLLHGADSILLVTTPDHSTVYQTAWMLRQIRDLGIPKGKVGLAVTHAGTRGMRGPREIAQMLDLPLMLALPNDPGRHEAARVTRRPMALRERPDGPFHTFVRSLIADDEPAAKKPRRGILFGRAPQTKKGGQL